MNLRQPIRFVNEAPRNPRPMVAAAAALVIALGLALMMAWPWDANAATAERGPSREALQQALARHPLHTLDKRTLDAGTLRGEVVVLNFWASWCTPCRRELPALNALHAELAPRGGQVVAVSVDEELANVQRFAKVHALSLPIVADGPDGLAHELDLQHVPMTLVLDRDGAVALVVTGAGDEAIARIGAKARELLSRPTADASLSTGGSR
jgi:thiol-disulfide isomerase/thioredoxin